MFDVYTFICGLEWSEWNNEKAKKIITSERFYALQAVLGSLDFVENAGAEVVYFFLDNIIKKDYQKAVYGARRK